MRMGATKNRTKSKLIRVDHTGRPCNSMISNIPLSPAPASAAAGSVATAERATAAEATATEATTVATEAAVATETTHVHAAH